MITINSVDLFKKAAVSIPGYSRFLKSNGCDPATINTVEDYAKVPISSKKDYLQKFSQKDVMWPEDWGAQILYCSTSGSTGTPHYFPRNRQLAEKASYMVEEFLKNSSHGEGRTLVLMGFGMGVWIGGVFTMHAFEIAAERTKTAIAILPTGYNRAEVFKALKKLSPEYDQTIIAGYPPFIKEIVDDAPAEGLDLSKLNIRLMFAAEAFSELFRDYICEKAGVNSPIVDTINIYGSADLGAMAHETPLCILVRRLAMEKPRLFEEIFGQIEKTPTFAQYNPDFIEFEVTEGQLVLTGDSAVPLVRYAIGDHGGVISYKKLRDILANHGLSIDHEAKKARVPITKRPFLYVYERTDFSTNLHGINIFPEFIKDSLNSKQLSKNVTGRFTMATEHDDNHVQFIKLNIELKKNVFGDSELSNQVVDAIYQGLVSKSSEFAEIANNIDSKDLIKIVLWEKGHKRYFTPGSKQKWVEKPQR